MVRNMNLHSISIKGILLFLICLFIGDNVSYAIVLNTKKLKIANDGNSLCTLQLQRAIDKVCNNGGGRLDVTPGKYLTGSIMLKSGVELHLMNGAVILGSTNPKDYYSINAKPTADRRNDNSNIALVMADNAKNISITGDGTIDGQGLMLALNIILRDITCTVPFERPDENYDLRGPEVDFFHNPFPSSICGIPGNKIQNVLLENINIVYPGRATKGMAYVPLWRANKIDEQIKSYPEFSMFGELPSWGFYIRHVSGITFNNVKLSLADRDYRPAFVLEDAEKVVMKAVSLPNDNDRQIYFVDK